MLITVESVFFNIITHLLLNSDYGIGCVYSPLGLVTFVAVEGTFVRFTKGHDHFISNSISCGYLRKDQCNIACLQTEMRGGDELCHVIYALRVCRCRRYLLCFLILCVQIGGRYAAHRVWYSFASVVHDSRIGRHLAGYN